MIRTGGAKAIFVGRRRVKRERRQSKATVVARVTYRKGSSLKMDNMEAVEAWKRGYKSLDSKTAGKVRLQRARSKI